ncbi:MAG: right-handed parallel beta-helix repeat-containing protein [Solirubrobacterales bacterium]
MSRRFPVLLAIVLTVLAATAASASAATTYVDCQAPSAGADGSRAHPLTSLTDASAIPLEAGSRLLLRRGTECAGTLDLSGSGAKGAPALVSAYGEGERPLVTATGEDGVRLLNTAHVVVEYLEVANPGDGSGKKRGIHVIAADRTVPGVAIRSNIVRNVGGNLDKDGGGSGGIQIDSEGADGRFRHLVIADNRIRNVSRSGIFIVGTTDGDRPRASGPWPEASHGVRVRRNIIRRMAGDGIVALGTDGARVRGNFVAEGNLAGRGLADPQGMICNAGIWAFHANNTLIEHNVVSGMKFNGCDGSGYDIDYDQDGTVVQFNQSYDNEGGFMLLCTDDQPRTAQVRFNLSVNDGFSFNSSPCSRPAGSYAGLRIYNNTIVGPDPGVGTLGYDSSSLYGPPGLDFFNNAIVATEEGRGFTCDPGCHHNLFWKIPPAGTDAVVARPEFVRRRPLDSTPISFLPKPDSPLVGAGARIPRDAVRDFFGTKIRRSDDPDIGFAQVP